MFQIVGIVVRNLAVIVGWANTNDMLWDMLPAQTNFDFNVFKTPALIRCTHWVVLKCRVETAGVGELQRTSRTLPLGLLGMAPLSPK